VYKDLYEEKRMKEIVDGSAEGAKADGEVEKITVRGRGRRTRKRRG